MGTPLALASFTVALLVSAALTRLWLDVTVRLGLMDAPNPIVPQHRRATATMGGAPVGMAMLAIWAVDVALARRLGASGPGVSLAFALLPAGLGFLLLGAVDDVLRLSASRKLLAQIGLAALAVMCGLVFPFRGQSLFDGVASGVAIVTVVNAVNLTDVCDGLVAGMAAISLATTAVLWPDLAGWAAPAAGACLGFLIFNAPPARIFLGDAGSHWIGFLLVALPIAAARPEAGEDHQLQTVLLLGVFLLELVLLIVARTRRGLPVWRGSPDHFSLRLQAAGLSRWSTVLLAWGATAALGVVALLIPSASPMTRVAILAVLAGLAAAAFVALLALPVPARPAVSVALSEDCGAADRT